jgi:hypothetical protein
LSQLGDQATPVDFQRRPDIAQHEVGRDPVELEMAAGRKCREALLDLPLKASTTDPGKGAVAEIEPELRVLAADEVEHGQAWLLVGQAQPPAQLLKEDGGALGGTQEQDRVDGGDVDTLVEQVDGEEYPYLAVAKSPEGGPSRSLIGPGGDRPGGDAGLIEPVGHVLGVVDADAESECPHASDVGDLVPERLQDDPGPRIVARIDVAQLGGVVTLAASPPDLLEVGFVVDAEVLEGRQ